MLEENTLSLDLEDLILSVRAFTEVYDEFPDPTDSIHRGWLLGFVFGFQSVKEEGKKALEERREQEQAAAELRESLQAMVSEGRKHLQTIHQLRTTSDADEPVNMRQAGLFKVSPLGTHLEIDWADDFKPKQGKKLYEIVEA